MLSPISLAAFSTVPAGVGSGVAPASPLAAAQGTGPVSRPFADPSRQVAPTQALPTAPGATLPRGSLLDLSV
jgi:hypothetical protein